MTCRWVYDDGGRKAAGYVGKADDCVCRAIAIATERPYTDIYQLIDTYGMTERKTARRTKRSAARTGVYKATIKRLLTDLGWKWTPTMFIGKGCTVHLCAAELPKGRILVSVSRHLVAVVDGVVHDTHDPTRTFWTPDGRELQTRCVYGYWTRGEDRPHGVNRLEGEDRLCCVNHPQ